MRISDWSSDVCSSDLVLRRVRAVPAPAGGWPGRRARSEARHLRHAQAHQPGGQFQLPWAGVFPVLVAPAGHRAQAMLGPCGRAQVLDRRVAATQDGHEVMDALAQPVVEPRCVGVAGIVRSEEHTSELQSLMRITNAVIWLTKNSNNATHTP